MYKIQFIKKHSCFLLFTNILTKKPTFLESRFFIGKNEKHFLYFILYRAWGVAAGGAFCATA